MVEMVENVKRAAFLNIHLLFLTILHFLQLQGQPDPVLHRGAKNEGVSALKWHLRTVFLTINMENKILKNMYIGCTV